MNLHVDNSNMDQSITHITEKEYECTVPSSKSIKEPRLNKKKRVQFIRQDGKHVKLTYFCF